MIDGLRTNINRFFSVLTFIFIFPSSTFSQQSYKNLEGLGLDFGAGYNTLKVNIKKNGSDSLVTYKRFLLSPCMRLHYDLRLKEFGKLHSLKLKTFLSYYSFGGKIKRSDIGEYDIIVLSSAEIGTGLALNLYDMFQIVPVAKAQYIFSVTERYIRETTKPPTDLTKDFQSFAYNAGIQLRFKYKHFTMATEAWLGLSNLFKTNVKDIREKNFRLLLGYEF